MKSDTRDTALPCPDGKGWCNLLKRWPRTPLIAGTRRTILIYLPNEHVLINRPVLDTSPHPAEANISPVLLHINN